MKKKPIDESLDFYLEHIYYHRRKHEDSLPEDSGKKCIQGYGVIPFKISPEDAKRHTEFWREGLREWIERECSAAAAKERRKHERTE